MENSVQSDLAKLAGCILTDVGIRTFCVELLLMGDLSITVRINKKFSFALGEDEEAHFDPALMKHDTSAESTKFIFMRGMRCGGAVLEETKFVIAFEAGARLWVDLDDRDFEPFEVIGASGERYEKMEFYHVL